MQNVCAFEIYILLRITKEYNYYRYILISCLHDRLLVFLFCYVLLKSKLPALGQPSPLPFANFQPCGYEETSCISHITFSVGLLYLLLQFLVTVVLDAVKIETNRISNSTTVAPHLATSLIWIVCALTAALAALLCQLASAAMCTTMFTAFSAIVFLVSSGVSCMQFMWQFMPNVI